jgi:hypothetical protein
MTPRAEDSSWPLRHQHTAACAVCAAAELHVAGAWLPEHAVVWAVVHGCLSKRWALAMYQNSSGGHAQWPRLLALYYQHSLTRGLLNLAQATHQWSPHTQVRPEQHGSHTAPIARLHTETAFGSDGRQ